MPPRRILVREEKKEVNIDASSATKVPPTINVVKMYTKPILPTAEEVLPDSRLMRRKKISELCSHAFIDH